MTTNQPAEPPLANARQTMTGLEFFRRMRDGLLTPPPMIRLLGLELVEVDEGRVVFTGVAGEPFYNGLGIAHGGFAATMLDSALGCAINTTQPAGRMFTTVELKINYTRPLSRDVGTIRCEAHVIHIGTRTATAEARIVDADGRIYAHATTTCIVIV
jgi:uncharacterized protein (TIGR00369 family)